MGWLEIAGTAVASGTFGGIVTKLVDRWVDAKKSTLQHVREERAAQVAEAQKTVQDLRDILQNERQILQEQMAQFLNERKDHLDCLTRVARIEGEFAAFRAQHSQCPEKIAHLEGQVKILRDELLEHYIKGSEGSPSTSGTKTKAQSGDHHPPVRPLKPR